MWPWFAFGLVVGAATSVLLLERDLELGKVTEALGRFFPEDSHQAADEPAVREAPAKPRFEFYTMLPEMEVAVPEEEIPAAAPVDSSQPDGATERKADAYLLQVGSFRARNDAERLKAELALLGVVAAVQSVVIDGKNTWHRVRVGPYTDLSALNSDRVRLRENRYETLVLRIRSSG